MDHQNKILHTLPVALKVTCTFVAVVLILLGIYFTIKYRHKIKHKFRRGIYSIFSKKGDSFQHDICLCYDIKHRFFAKDVFEAILNGKYGFKMSCASYNKSVTGDDNRTVESVDRTSKTNCILSCEEGESPTLKSKTSQNTTYEETEHKNNFEKCLKSSRCFVFVVWKNSLECPKFLNEVNMLKAEMLLGSDKDFSNRLILTVFMETEAVVELNSILNFSGKIGCKESSVIWSECVCLQLRISTISSILRIAFPSSSSVLKDYIKRTLLFCNGQNKKVGKDEKSPLLYEEV